MTELRRYTVETPAGDEVTVQLSATEARARGLKAADGKTSSSEEAEPPKRSTATKRAEVADKSFGPAKKKP